MSKKTVMLCFLSRFNTDRTTKKLIESIYDYDNRPVSEPMLVGYHSNQPGMEVLAKHSGLNKIFMLVTKADKQVLKYQDAHNVEHGITHIELFKNIMCAKYPRLLDCFEEIEYDEEDNNATSFSQVVKMSDQILSYINEEHSKGNEIHLVADMTGGLRNANMIMLGIIQLMEYVGVLVDKIIYTYYDLPTKTGLVKNETECQSFSKLVAGAEAFIKYGRADVLEEFFDGIDVSDELKQLLEAIQKFSDALSTCQQGIISSCLDNLKETLIVYDTKISYSEHEQAFNIILQRIKREFANILGNPKDKLSLLDWCLDKGLLQQAMTFYTEWIPSVLVESKIIYVKKEYSENILEVLKKQKDDFTSWQKYLLSTWQISKKKIADENGTIGKSAARTKDVKQGLMTNPFAKLRELEIVQESSLDNTIEERMTVLEKYLSDGTIKTQVNKDMAVKCCQDYTELRVLRNQINHANEGVNINSKDIKEKIKESIGYIRKVGQELLKQKVEIWKNMPRNNPDEMLKADSYFDEELMPLTAEKFVANNSAERPYFGMFLTLGSSWQPLALSIMALKPKKICFLATDETIKYVNTIVKFAGLLENMYETVEVARSDIELIYEAIEERSDWLEKGKCCMDITGGTKAMVSGAAMMGAIKNMDIYYVESKYLPLYRRPEPGSEYIKKLMTPKDWKNLKNTGEE